MVPMYHIRVIGLVPASEVADSHVHAKEKYCRDSRRRACTRIRGSNMITPLCTIRVQTGDSGTEDGRVVSKFCSETWHAVGEPEGSVRQATEILVKRMYPGSYWQNDTCRMKAPGSVSYSLYKSAYNKSSDISPKKLNISIAKRQIQSHS